MLNDDDPSRVVRSSKDDPAVSDRENVSTGRIYIDGVPVLTGVPKAGVIPGILASVPVTDEESGAWSLLRPGNRQSYAGHSLAGHSLG